MSGSSSSQPHAWLPRISTSAAYISIAAGFAPLVLLAQFSTALPRSSGLAIFLAKYPFDALLLQFFSVAIVGKMACVHISTYRAVACSFRTWLTSCLVVGFMLIVLFPLEMYVVKPIVFFDRPPLFTSDSYFVGRVRSFWSDSIENHGTSAPSGFMMRQVWICFLGLGYWNSLKDHARLKSQDQFRMKIFALGIVVLSALVAFSRIAIGAHSLFDILMAVAVGTYLQWLLYYLLASGFGYRECLDEVDIFGISAMTIPLLMYYSTRIHYWLFLVGIAIALMAIVPRIRPLGKIHRDVQTHASN